MKVAISTIGKFHSFDLARQMLARDALAGIHTGYPRFKLKNEGIPAHLLHTFPYLQTPYMAIGKRAWFGDTVIRQWEYASRVTLDWHVSRTLPECDVFVGLSGSSLWTGRQAKARGAVYVCDRGSTHIREQDHLLRTEYDRWGLKFEGVDPRVFAREEAEYEEADMVTVPSDFALESFVARGVAPSKIKLLPYGVNLGAFKRCAEPDETAFEVLFVGAFHLRKGVPYLIQAFQKLALPGKRLTFAGSIDWSLVQHLQKRGIWDEAISMRGHVPQTQLRELMSRSHVLVLPSIEDGFGLVLAQAMACGCPVIASQSTGARNLYEDGVEGYVVPTGDADAIAGKLQYLADNGNIRNGMSQSALRKVAQIGGWDQYGSKAIEHYSSQLT